MWKITLFLFLAVGIPTAFSLSCVGCGAFPCQTPKCCDSGFYTLDECGCCLTCAKPQGDSCGGPFGIAGSCASGLRCLRSCGCTTVTNKECIFPFSYRGATYSRCTTDNSENGAAWCATQVNGAGEVVDGKWEDCTPNCSDFCDEGFLFNVNGRCINETVASSRLATFKTGNVPAQLDDELKNQQSAQLCDRIRTKADEPNFCRCVTGVLEKDFRGQVKGGCTKPSSGDGGFNDDLSEGYCFLENIQDPQNPSANCWDDTAWSPVDGRFYSNQACIDKREEEGLNNRFS